MLKKLLQTEGIPSNLDWNSNIQEMELNTPSQVWVWAVLSDFLSKSNVLTEGKNTFTVKKHGKHDLGQVMKVS